MSDVKRNEYTLPIANWLREQVNETLARYDIPSDVYDTDILIDALCVCAVDKSQATLRARLADAERERDEARKIADHDKSLWIDAVTRAERAEAALHGPIAPLTQNDMANIIAHLSYDLEPSGPLPNRNSVMMALIEAQNAHKAALATARRDALEDAAKTVESLWAYRTCAEVADAIRALANEAPE